MSPQKVIFLILAAITVVSAIRVVTVPLITHAALFMALTFVAVAGVFIQLQADFLAAAQVLVYAGAITTMVIFAVMLSDIREVRTPEKGLGFWRVAFSKPFGLIPVVAAIGFTAAMYWVYSRAKWPLSKEIPVPSTVQAIGSQLFDPNGFVIPFEVASLILLVAMVGAIILTAKEER